MKKVRLSVEDQIDIKEARKAFAEAKKKGARCVPWAEVKKKMKL